MVFDLTKITLPARKPIPEEVLQRYTAHYAQVIEERFNFKSSPENAESFAAVVRYTAHWRAAKEGLGDYPERGLFLFGEPGTGKTTALQLFSGLCDVEMITTDELSKAFALKSGTGFWTLVDDYNTRHLIVDDLGCEENAKSFGNHLPIADFIRERERLWQNSRLLTLFTSNAQDRSSLSRKYGKNVCSRLLGMCDFLKFHGFDHRLKR